VALVPSRFNCTPLPSIPIKKKHAGKKFHSSYRPKVTDHIHSQMDPIYTLTPYVVQVSFNIFLHLYLVLPRCLFQSCFTAKIFISISYDITLCSPLKVNRRFGATRRLHLCLLPPSRHFISWLFLLYWRWEHVPPKRRLSFNGLHGVISQKIEIFTTTAVRTSDVTKFCTHFCFLRSVLLAVLVSTPLT
jgi:hypothetical protein